ncbi:MAG: phosphodiesterase YaeI [Chthoniobacterales bacterium]
MGRNLSLPVGILAGIAGLTLYARYIEPSWLIVRRIRLSNLPGSQSPLKIVQLSDLHASESVPLSLIRRAVEKTIQLKPDLICLTGDYITDRYSNWDAYSETLRPLASCAPVYAVLGNHDGGSWASSHVGGYESFKEVTRMLGKAGVHVLRNSHVDFQKGNRLIHLIGLGDVWSKDCKPEKAWDATISENDTIVVLAHNPDSKANARPYPWHLMLSGHTHGGQVVFPGNYAPFAEISDQDYARGLCPYDGRSIYITRGVGNLRGWRFCCPPEITEITL